jgi:hypothetical protein
VDVPGAYAWLHKENLDWVAIWTFFQVVVIALAAGIALKQLASYRAVEGIRECRVVRDEYEKQATSELSHIRKKTDWDRAVVADIRALALVAEFFSYAQRLYYSGALNKNVFKFFLGDQTVDAWYFTKPFRDKWGIGIAIDQFDKLARECYGAMERTYRAETYPDISFDFVAYDEQQLRVTNVEPSGGKVRVIHEER